MRAVLLAAGAACAVEAYEGHARSLRSARAPNVFTVPELRTHVIGGWRALAEQQAANGGAPVRPALRRSVLAHTDIGFVDFDHTTIAKHTALFTEDYAALLRSVTFTCAPAVAGERPVLDAATDQVVRNDVMLMAEFPVDAVATPDYAHLAPRLREEDAYLVLDLHLLAEHDSFAPGTGCAEQIPYTASSCALGSAPPHALHTCPSHAARLTTPPSPQTPLLRAQSPPPALAW